MFLFFYENILFSISQKNLYFLQYNRTLTNVWNLKKKEDKNGSLFPEKF